MSKKRSKFTIHNKFGQKVRALRLSKEMTQLDLAVACDVECTTISRIENGRTNVTLTTIELLASGLELEIAELMKF
jgi:transcriptional regulator with XRE-family HTH domain